MPQRVPEKAAIPLPNQEQSQNCSMGTILLSSDVDINKIYTDLPWVMDHRTPRGVTKEELTHYTDFFVHRGLHPAPKRILVYGQPGK